MKGCARLSEQKEEARALGGVQRSLLDRIVGRFLNEKSACETDGGATTAAWQDRRWRQGGKTVRRSNGRAKGIGMA